MRERFAGCAAVSVYMVALVNTLRSSNPIILTWQNYTHAYLPLLKHKNWLVLALQHPAERKHERSRHRSAAAGRHSGHFNTCTPPAPPRCTLNMSRHWGPNANSPFSGVATHFGPISKNIKFSFPVTSIVARLTLQTRKSCLLLLCLL